MLIFFVNIFFSILFILIRIAFFTLLERKGLAYSQRRQGPNKHFWGGIIQPILDALKLLIKKVSIPQQISPTMFFVSPGIFFFLIIQVWFSFPGVYSLNSFS